MARYPWLVALTLTGGALLVLTGAVGLPCRLRDLCAGCTGREAAPPAQSADPRAPHESAEAVRLLDQAIAAHAPGRPGWVEMTLWQRHHDEGSTHEIQGRYVAAPDQRLRLELQVRVGRTHGELILVNDGAALWQALRFDGGEPRLTQVSLAEEPEKGAEVLRQQAFLGVGPLLRVLRQGMHQPRRQAAHWQGKEVIQVSGDWPEDPSKLADVPDYQRPRHPPRRCRLYLDAQTLWPHRIEWQGASAADGTAPLLLELEFRDPILNRPLPPERCAREFTVWPG
jgi:hypothetical protein